MSADVDDCTDALIGRALRTEGGHLSIGRAGSRCTTIAAARSAATTASG